MAFIKRESIGNLLSTSWYQYAVQRTRVPMPNCFTYACARISEIIGYNQPLDIALVRGAGDLWEAHASEFTNQPYARLGALMIWKGGMDHLGHVAVVEDIIDGFTIQWSESNHRSNLFGIVNRNPNEYEGMTFMGYLYHKDLPEEIATIPQPTNKPLHQIMEVGSLAKLRGVFHIDQVLTQMDSVWSRELTGDGGNSVQAGPLTRCTINGVTTENQVFSKGDYFFCNDKFSVLAVNATSDAIQINVGGRVIWVYASPCDEVQ